MISLPVEKASALLTRFREACRQEAELEAKSHEKIFNKATLYVSGLFAGFIAIILWKPLTHPDLLPGAGDIAHAFTFKYFWIRSLQEGHPAFWNPYTALGQPFVAMLSPGAYAPLNFLYFINPLSYGFTLSYFFHFFIAALGTYFFIRSLGTSWQGACLGGMAFAFSGFFMGHFFAGHALIISSSSWIPLALYCLKRFTDLKSFTSLLLAAAALGLCNLEGMPQMNMYAMMFSGFFLLWAWVRGRINWKELLAAGGTLVIVSVSLSFCQLAPSFEFIQHCDRWQWGYNSIMTDFFHNFYFQFLINPFFLGVPWTNDYRGQWGYQEVVIYIGLIPLFLALCGLWVLRKRPMGWWLLFVAVLSAMLGMAESTRPTKALFMFFYQYLPGFGHNRSVARIMFFTAFALCCLAGLALDGWIKYWRRRRRPASPAWRNFLARTVPILLLAGTVLNLGWYDLLHTTLTWNYHELFSPDIMISPRLLDKIKADPTYPRFQPENQGQGNLLHKVSQVMNNYPMMVEPSAAYVAQEWFYKDNPLQDLIRLNYNFRPFGSTPTERWQPLEGRIWTDAKALPRAFMVGGYEVNPNPVTAIFDIRDSKTDIRQEVVLSQDPEGKPDWPKGWVGEAPITHYDYDEVELECANDRPCFLLLSDNYFPGWRAWVDGKEETIYLADGSFRAIELKEPGHHSVKMTYCPPLLLGSLLFSASAWLLLAAVWLFRGRLGLWYSSLFGGRLLFAKPLEARALGPQAKSPRTRSLARRRR